jgi:ABC-type uncharacterized transport system ATPase subunit
MRSKVKVLVKGNNVKVLFVGTVFSRSNVIFFNMNFQATDPIDRQIRESRLYISMAQTVQKLR